MIRRNEYPARVTEAQARVARAEGSFSEPAVCAICGVPFDRATIVRFHGHAVSKKCRDRFALRRELAWIIDYVLITVLFNFGLVMLVFVVHAFARGYAGLDDADAPKPGQLVISLVFVIVFLVFLLKDSVRGTSPGKLVTGLQVVDKDTAMPIGPLASFKRNLIVCIPLAAFVLPFLMRAGPRPGEGWANTRVIDRRRAGAPAHLGDRAALADSNLASREGWR